MSHFQHLSSPQITKNPDLLTLLCDQGKQLERSCEFYFALKYYFAGLQYFKRSPPPDLKMQELSRRFKSLFENLLPFSNQQVCIAAACNALISSNNKLIRSFKPHQNRIIFHNFQVYEQARSTVEYQRGVMRRGTMMK